MKITKVVKEILVLLTIFLIALYSGRFFLNNVLGINILKISDYSCCGLVSGSIALFKGFNPSTLKHGEIILFNNPQTGQIGFSQVIAFPGEGLFQDLYTGKWGYIEKVELEETEIIIITPNQISNLFAKITWLDSPTFQPTILSEDLYDRLLYLFEDEQKYRTASDIDPKLPYTGAVKTEQILGVYGLTLASADKVWLYYLASFTVPFVVSLVIFTLLWRIFRKLKKNKPLSDLPQPSAASK